MHTEIIKSLEAVVLGNIGINFYLCTVSLSKTLFFLICFLLGDQITVIRNEMSVSISKFSNVWSLIKQL